MRVLTPANDPPDNGCVGLWTAQRSKIDAAASDRSLKAILGGGSTMICFKDKCDILDDNSPNAADPQLLSLERKGSILEVHAVVYDESGKIVVSLDNDRPHVNKNNAYDWSRPDEHTIDIKDQRNRRVLHIRFKNKHEVYVEGLFYNARGESLNISSSEMVIRILACLNQCRVSA